MCALRIASRNSGSSAASIVICVKNTMSSGSSASAPSARSAPARTPSSSCSRVLSSRRAAMRQVGQRDRVEVVVGERDEPEAAAPQLARSRRRRRRAPRAARLLAVGPPDRAERAVLRAAAHGLHRRPHVAAFGSRSQRAGAKRRAANAAAVVDAAAGCPAAQSASTVGHIRSPSPLTTACAAPWLARLVREKSVA